jgi:hypothetical protein
MTERATGFDAAICGDPACGLHLIATREDNSPICEIVIGRGQLRRLIQYAHDVGLLDQPKGDLQ